MRSLSLLVLICCCTVLVSAASGPEIPDAPESLRTADGWQAVYLPSDYAEACRLLQSYNAGRDDDSQVVPDLAAWDAESRLGSWDPMFEAFLEATGGTDAQAEWRRFPLFADVAVDPSGRVRHTNLLVLFVPAGIEADHLQRRLEQTYLALGHAAYPQGTRAYQARGLGAVLSDGLSRIAAASGLAQLRPGNYIMILVGLGLLYLGIAKGFEPLLLVPIATGCIFVNAMGAGMVNVAGPSGTDGGLLYYFFNFGINTGIFPLLIFLGVGALTDFGPLLANPWSALLGAAAQIGIFGTFFVAAQFTDLFSLQEAAAIAIIGGADGPTSIYVAARLAPDLLGAIAVAAYSYMALVPIIQPPIMQALTNDAERQIMMEQRRPVSKQAKILFPIVVILACVLLLPDAVPLVGMLMFGNLLKESGVTDRLSKAAQNEIINIVTIFLGLAVGTKLAASDFLDIRTLIIVVLGCLAFMAGTAGGVLMAKLMNAVTGGRINPLIGSAGVSAVPMAARVSQVVGQKYNRQNMLLMHAMGPNVAGVIGSAVAAGILLALLG